MHTVQAVDGPGRRGGAGLCDGTRARPAGLTRSRRTMLEAMLQRRPDVGARLQPVSRLRSSHATRRSATCRTSRTLPGPPRAGPKVESAECRVDQSLGV